MELEKAFYGEMTVKSLFAASLDAIYASAEMKERILSDLDGVV